MHLQNRVRDEKARVSEEVTGQSQGQVSCIMVDRLERQESLTGEGTNIRRIPTRGWKDVEHVGTRHRPTCGFSLSH